MKPAFKRQPRALDSRVTCHVSRNTQYAIRNTFPHSLRAFTLIEILIALSIFCLVLVSIHSTWMAILRASRAGQDAAIAVQRARMAGRTIEEALGSVQSFAANQLYYSFVADNGSDSTLSFVARLSPSFPRSGKFGGLDLRRVTFSVENGESGSRQLVLRQQPLLMDLDRDEKDYPLVLAKNVRQFKTEFYDARLEDWIDEWKQTNQIPTLVRVNLELADPSHPNRTHDQITRIVSIPSVTVQGQWQPRMIPGGPGTPGAQPGAPGAQPGTGFQQPGNLQPGVIQNPGAGVNPSIPPR